MVSTDPISDMLTRIRNAILVQKAQVNLPYSRIKESIANLLVENDFIKGVRVEGEGVKKQLVLSINSVDRNSNISVIERISTPGRRQYVNVSDIPTIKQGRGIVIISTSQGLMTGKEARKSHLGGELICKVY